MCKNKAKRVTPIYYPHPREPMCLLRNRGAGTVYWSKTNTAVGKTSTEYYVCILLYFWFYARLLILHDTVDHKQLLKILEGYGIEPTACGLLKSHWDTQSCVATQEKKLKNYIQEYTTGTTFEPNIKKRSKKWRRRWWKSWHDE